MADRGIGDEFQERTKYDRAELRAAGRGGLDWASKPPTYKRYPGAAEVALPEPLEHGGPPLWDVVWQRRSERRFRDMPLTLAELSQLLWASQGITSARRGVDLRAAPSAGALYPVETYVVVHAVEGVKAGVYHYGVQHHHLEQLALGNFRAAIAKAALYQRMAAEASLVLVWTAVFERSKWKYRQRAYRYVYLDAGHIAQNAALAAVALGLGSCQIAALYDHEANHLLGIDGVEESTIYMTAIGHPVQRRDGS